MTMQLPNTFSRALYLKTGRAVDYLQEFELDWAEARQLIGSDLSGEATITELNAQADTVTASYAARDRTGTKRLYRLEYLRILRNGASCRVVDLQEEPPDSTPSTVGALEEVRDTPGLDLHNRPAANTTEDPALSLLRSVLSVGARIALP